MKVLLDAHAFLWYFTADPRLSKTAATTMADVNNELFISIASLWEIGIKASIGKLTLPAPFATVIPQQLQQASISRGRSNFLTWESEFGAVMMSVDG